MTQLTANSPGIETTKNRRNAPDYERLLAASEKKANIGSWQAVLQRGEVILPEAIYWSDETFRIFGYQPLEIEPSVDLFLSRLHPDDTLVVVREIQQAFERATDFDIDFRIIRKDGRHSLLHAEMEFEYPDEDHGIWTGTIQDVTSIKSAQKSEGILNSIFDNTEQSYTVLDAQLNIVSFNKAAADFVSRYWGKPLQAGTSIIDVVAPDRKEMLTALYDTVIGGARYTYETCGPVTEDGAIRWFSVTAFPVMLGHAQATGITLAMEDITERKRAEDRIRAADTRYRTFFENSLDGLLISKRDGEILAANPAMCSLFRMTEEEIKEAGRFGLVDMHSPGVVPFVRQRQATGSAKGELSFLRKDGSTFPGILSSVVYNDANDEEHTSSIIHDITQRKVAEELISQMNKELKSLTVHLHTVREEERSRIATEIHEELGQQLMAAKMGVSIALKKLKAANLSDDTMLELLGQLDEGIKTVRRITAYLRPVVIDHEGLSSAMRWHVSEFERLHDISCVINAELPRDFVDKEISINLFRIFQDTVDNILFHTSSTAINIDLKLDDENILLTITDNGEVKADGIAAGNERFAISILSMKERAGMIGGSYSIEKLTDTTGTITTVIIPYPVQD